MSEVDNASVHKPHGVHPDMLGVHRTASQTWSLTEGLPEGRGGGKRYPRVNIFRNFQNMAAHSKIKFCFVPN